MAKWGKKKQQQTSGHGSQVQSSPAVMPKSGPKRRRWIWVVVSIVVIVGLVAAGSWAVWKKVRHASNGPVVHSADEAAFKPSHFESELVKINQLFQDKKPKEAIAAAQALEATNLSPEDQKTLHVSVANQCYAAAEYACAAEYYGKLNSADLTLDQQLHYADALEKTGNKQGALDMYKSIKATRDSTYAQYESAPTIDKQVDEAIARLQ